MHNYCTIKKNNDKWEAFLKDHDLTCPVGEGNTIEEAIEDLRIKLEYAKDNS